MSLNKTIEELSQKVTHSSKLNTQISNKGIDWHIDHSLNVIINVCRTLKKSNPKDYNPSFSFTKHGILLTGIIPRGKGRAPKKVVTEDEISDKMLQLKLNEAKEGVNELENLQKNSNFSHPLFGFMNLKTSIKFLKIHTNHHLKIMNDILKE